MRVIIGTIELDCRLEGCRSLKEKRARLRSVIDRVRRRHNASIAEIGDQNLWGNAVLGIAIAASSSISAERELGRIIEGVEDSAGFEIIVCDSRVHRV